MNKVILIGRLTKDPATSYTTGAEPLAVARYSLAVDRMKKDAGADFINCVAFGKNAEFAEKYLKKGQKIAVEGRIQTGSYEKDNVKHYTTDIVVERHEFCESSRSNETPAAGFDEGYTGGNLDEDIPFT